MTRKFEYEEAKRSNVPLLVGLFGPSGSGKTYSALRLATGIQSVSGGDIAVIDTEADRAKHYAGEFKFKHLRFGEPFGSLDYLAAIEHCVDRGARVIVIDSMSHEHEGEGGMLDAHEKELERLAGDVEWKRNAMKFSAWAKPKQDRRRMLNKMLQLHCSFILCFRAKEKIRLLSKSERDDAKKAGEFSEPVRQLGWMPIGDPMMVYEMMLSALLLPGCDGRPVWDSLDPGTKTMTRLPKQFRELFPGGIQLSEEIGAAMATWASGGTITVESAFDRIKKALESAKETADLRAAGDDLRKAKSAGQLSVDQVKELARIGETRKAELAKPTAPEIDRGDNPEDY